MRRKITQLIREVAGNWNLAIWLPVGALRYFANQSFSIKKQKTAGNESQRTVLGARTSRSLTDNWGRPGSEMGGIPGGHATSPRTKRRVQKMGYLQSPFGGRTVIADEVKLMMTLILQLCFPPHVTRSASDHTGHMCFPRHCQCL